MLENNYDSNLLQLALDRMKLPGPSGTVYGALLDIRDATEGGSRMRVNVPIQAKGRFVMERLSPVTMKMK